MPLNYFYIKYFFLLKTKDSVIMCSKTKALKEVNVVFELYKKTKI